MSENKLSRPCQKYLVIALATLSGLSLLFINNAVRYPVVV